MFTEERKPNDTDEDVKDLAREIDNLSEEIEELKGSLREKKKKSKTKEEKSEVSVDYAASFTYLSDLLENSTDNIITEMKSEFFRLFNFLTSMLSVTPNQKELKMLQEKSFVSNQTDTSKKETTLMNPKISDLEREKNLLQILLEERESLIYELSDQLVSIENEKKNLEEEMAEIERIKAQWLDQKHILEKLVQTDPRFNIITLLRRMGIIAPIQLSFVLGVSLSQTRRYIKELEEMNILKINEDETISLHPSFNEETMNIKINTDKT